MINQKNHVIIFDLHEVLVKMDYKRIFFSLLKKAYRIDIILILCKPSSLRLLKELFATSRVPEQYFLSFAKQYSSFEKLMPFFISLLNQQNLLHDSITIVKQLKQHGYHLYLFSNIGEKTFKDFSKTHQNILQFFDGIIYTQEHDNWIQKPSKQAFNKLLDLTHQKASNCLFIDNCKKNIISAQNLHFNVLLFSTPTKLEQDLKVLGYL